MSDRLEEIRRELRERISRRPRWLRVDPKWVEQVLDSEARALKEIERLRGASRGAPQEGKANNQFGEKNGSDE
jgi:hypothetical protein